MEIIYFCYFLQSSSIRQRLMGYDRLNNISHGFKLVPSWSNGSFFFASALLYFADLKAISNKQQKKICHVRNGH